MNGKRGGKTRSRAAWLVTWMALIAMGLTLSTPPTTAVDLSCALPAAEDAHIGRQSGALQNAPAQVCSILPAAGQDGEAQSEPRLSGPEITDPAPDAAPTTPAGGSAYYEFTPWEVRLKATGTTEYRGP